MIRKPDAEELADPRGAVPPDVHDMRNLVQGTTSFGERAVLGSVGLGILIETTLPFAYLTVPITIIGTIGWLLMRREDKAEQTAAFARAEGGQA